MGIEVKDVNEYVEIAKWFGLGDLVERVGLGGGRFADIARDDVAKKIPSFAETFAFPKFDSGPVVLECTEDLV